MNIYKFAITLFVALTSLNTSADNSFNNTLSLPITMISGEKVKLSDFKGKKPVYLKFWATWCRTCLEEMPHFEQTYKDNHDDLEVISINIGVNDNLKKIKNVIKKFDLTMPQAIDKSGDLVQALNVTGSPYHVLLDKDSNLVFKGFTDETLNRKIRQLSRGETPDPRNLHSENISAKSLKFSPKNNETHILFFTTTWCNWYFESSNSRMAKNCINAQKMVNSLSAEEGKGMQWHGFISRLWTGKKETAGYKKKYALTFPYRLDEKNEVFHEFNIKTIPTLLVVKNKKIVSRITDFSDRDHIASVIISL